jgi:diguanylate cyclase (GGDEF)-like protein
VTVASKVNAFTIFIAILASTIVCASFVRSEYIHARNDLIDNTLHQISDRSDLPVLLLRDDYLQLEKSMRNILSSSQAARSGVLFDPRGTPLVRVEQSGANTYPLISLRQLRGNTSTAENSVTHRNTEVAPSGGIPLALLGGKDQLWDLTIPVLSTVNPVAKNLDAAEMQEVMAQYNSGSRHVIGYVHVSISRAMLVFSMLPTLLLILFGTAALIFACTLLTLFATRRITAPFSTIVRMAEDISLGREVTTKKLEKNAEFKDLVALLNSIVGDFENRKTQMDVDHQLLSMKVVERTSQLSERNEELSRAVREVTESKDRLHKLAYYDSLTSLPNRRLFTEKLDVLLRLAKRNKETLGLLFLDLDNFKRINDSLGHSAGDLLLREIAKRLSRCIRDSDVLGHFVEPDSAIDVSRLGGDEFTVVLNQLSDPESAGIVAKRILEVLREPAMIEGHEIVVTPSIGIALAPGDADTVEGLLKAADTAMYHAKGTGKNSYALYSADMKETDMERLQLENDLRKAIERDELQLHYQPQVDTLNGTVVGAEALMRWEHPEHGMVPPFKFIPLAEEMGLISDIGEWGLERACHQMVELQSAGIHLPKVSVNVSALQFNAAFISRVEQVLRETGLRPSRLELELTEGIMMDGADETIDAIKNLKELGVQLSIDDFGTGYSSLSYLSRFPLDELKIDRSFVVSMENNDADASLVITIIAMAKSMNLALVAEGVENQEQYRFLRQHGAHVIQGYMFSKPLPFEELKPVLEPRYFKKQIDEIDAPAKVNSQASS